MFYDGLSSVTPTWHLGDTSQRFFLWEESQILLFIDNTWAGFMTPTWDFGWYGQRFMGGAVKLQQTLQITPGFSTL